MLGGLVSSDPPKESKVFFSKKKGKIYIFFWRVGGCMPKTKKSGYFLGDGEIGQIAPELQTKQNL